MQTKVIIAGNLARQVGVLEASSASLAPPLANGDSYYLDGEWGSILLREVVVNGFIVGHYTLDITLACQAQIYWGDLPSLIYAIAGKIPASREAAPPLPQGFQTYEDGGAIPVTTDILPGRHEAVRVYFQQTLSDKLRGGVTPLPATMETAFAVLAIDRKLRHDILGLARGIALAQRDYYHLNQRCLSLLEGYWKDVGRSIRLAGWETKKDAAIAALANYISAHLSIDDLPFLTKESLAARAGLPNYQFQARFRKIFRLSLADYLLEVRMEAARELLATTRSQLTEIAALTGYREASSLSRAFKKYFGYPPSMVRG